jgi:hypothetical protein
MQAIVRAASKVQTAADFLHAAQEVRAGAPAAFHCAEN